MKQLGKTLQEEIVEKKNCLPLAFQYFELKNNTNRNNIVRYQLYCDSTKTEIQIISFYKKINQLF